MYEKLVGQLLVCINYSLTDSLGVTVLVTLFVTTVSTVLVRGELARFAVFVAARRLLFVAVAHAVTITVQEGYSNTMELTIVHSLKLQFAMMLKEYFG